MTLDELRATLDEPQPPPGLSSALQALWWQGKGDWERAHRLAQAEDGADGAWVHAHLHRVEGDLSNAAYWYRRAGRPVATEALDEEWAAITSAMLPR
jgi:hypothetical protein